MKILGIIAVVGSLGVAIVMMSVVYVMACPKGSYEYRGSCEYDIRPEIAQPVQPSAEKPPSEKMPSWQRAGVVIATVSSMADVDNKLDQDKRDAETDGKKAAGLR